MAEEKNIAFGRNMEPAEYEATWANKLPKEQVVVIPAHDTVKEIPKDEKEGFDRDE